MNDKEKDKWAKECAAEYEKMIREGGVERGFIVDLLSGNFDSFDELMKREYPHEKGKKDK